LSQTRPPAGEEIDDAALHKALTDRSTKHA
jgi:hypothetical protein